MRRSEVALIIRHPFLLTLFIPFIFTKSFTPNTNECTSAATCFGVINAIFREFNDKMFQLTKI